MRTAYAEGPVVSRVLGAVGFELPSGAVVAVKAVAVAAAAADGWDSGKVTRT